MGNPARLTTTGDDTEVKGHGNIMTVAIGESEVFAVQMAIVRMNDTRQQVPILIKFLMCIPADGLTAGGDIFETAIGSHPVFPVGRVISHRAVTLLALLHFNGAACKSAPAKENHPHTQKPDHPMSNCVPPDNTIGIADHGIHRNRYTETSPDITSLVTLGSMACEAPEFRGERSHYPYIHPTLYLLHLTCLTNPLSKREQSLFFPGVRRILGKFGVQAGDVPLHQLFVCAGHFIYLPHHPGWINKSQCPSRGGSDITLRDVGEIRAGYCLLRNRHIHLAMTAGPLAVQ